MDDRPLAPWKLSCPWCDHEMLVFGRGMRGNDPGAGVEAAQMMSTHVEDKHGKTWIECLHELNRRRPRPDFDPRIDYPERFIEPGRPI